MSEILILKDNELRVLLAAIGVKNLYGFVRREKKEENIPYVIHELVRKKVIRQEDEQLKVNEPYASIIRGIKNARVILSIECERCIHLYIGERIVQMSDSINDIDSVKVGIVDEQMMFYFLEEAFKKEEQKDYPEEFIVGVQNEENATCMARVNLTEFDEMCINFHLYRWELFEGRYQYFIKETVEGSCEYIEYNKWNSSRIVEFIKRIAGGDTNDIN